MDDRTRILTEIIGRLQHTMMLARKVGSLWIDYDGSISPQFVGSHLVEPRRAILFDAIRSDPPNGSWRFSSKAAAAKVDRGFSAKSAARKKS